jgi:hypothetical protein
MYVCVFLSEGPQVINWPKVFFLGESMDIEVGAMAPLGPKVGIVGTMKK